MRWAAVALFLFCSLSNAQDPVRVRGTITAVKGDLVTVNDKQQVRLGEKTEIVYTQPIALSEIKPGDFLGVTSMKGPGGAQKIVVPESASISTLVPGNRAQLVVGAPVNLTMDATGTALRMQVSPKK